jgi:hypothetical protein
MLRKSFLLLPALIALLSLGAQSGLSQEQRLQFEKYPVQVYQGRLKIPKGIYKDAQGAWRDSLDKWCGEPAVNFAGEYWLDGHSCGTYCRYYTLSNLRTGAIIAAIDMFDATEEPPKTKDGHPYLTILHTRPDSRMLIAEYHLDFDNPDKEESCRQRYFVLEGGKLQPISKTLLICTEGRSR